MAKRITGKEIRPFNIRVTDYSRARQIKAERGLSLCDAVGCALEAWFGLSRDQQDEIVRSRMQRLHGEPASAA